MLAFANNYIYTYECCVYASALQRTCVLIVSFATEVKRSEKSQMQKETAAAKIIWDLCPPTE